MENEIDNLERRQEARFKTESFLEEGFKRSRMEIGGVSIKEVASIIRSTWHPFDVKSLIEELKLTKK